MIKKVYDRDVRTIYGFRFVPHSWAAYIAINGNGEVFQYDIEPYRDFGERMFRRHYHTLVGVVDEDFFSSTGLQWWETCFNFRERVPMNLDRVRDLNDSFLNGRGEIETLDALECGTAYMLSGRKYSLTGECINDSESYDLYKYIGSTVRESHPHVSSMYLYYQDARVYNRPWTNWCYRKHGVYGVNENWMPCQYHPLWDPGYEYKQIKGTYS